MGIVELGEVKMSFGDFILLYVEDALQSVGDETDIAIVAANIFTDLMHCSKPISRFSH